MFIKINFNINFPSTPTPIKPSISFMLSYHNITVPCVTWPGYVFPFYLTVPLMFDSRGE